MLEGVIFNFVLIFIFFAFSQVGSWGVGIVYFPLLILGLLFWFTFCWSQIFLKKRYLHSTSEWLTTECQLVYGGLILSCLHLYSCFLTMRWLWLGLRMDNNYVFVQFYVAGYQNIEIEIEDRTSAFFYTSLITSQWPDLILKNVPYLIPTQPHEITCHNLCANVASTINHVP